MTQPRHSLIDPQATTYYHCIARCVRRAFLCGRDRLTGRSFDHRKGWIVERLAALAEIFCIRVCAYAVMSNHLHVVLQIDPAAAESLPWEELNRRHARLFPVLHAQMETWAEEKVQERMELFRSRLAEISWFMRCLSESIARRANREDGCKGRFWEGRFKSQALLDEAALLTCMSYVDLNPVRAGLAESLEGSDFTSIQQRLRQAAGRLPAGPADPAKDARRVRTAGGRASGKASSGVRVRLAGFCRGRSAPVRPSGPRADRALGGEAGDRLPVSFGDYLALVQWAGQRLEAGKRGALSPALPASSRAVLVGLDLDPEHWLDAVQEFGRHFFTCAGSVLGHSGEFVCRVPVSNSPEFPRKTPRKSVEESAPPPWRNSRRKGGGHVRPTRVGSAARVQPAFGGPPVRRRPTAGEPAKTSAAPQASGGGRCARPTAGPRTTPASGLLDGPALGRYAVQARPPGRTHPADPLRLETPLRGAWTGRPDRASARRTFGQPSSRGHPAGDSHARGSQPRLRL